MARPAGHDAGRDLPVGDRVVVLIGDHLVELVVGHSFETIPRECPHIADVGQKGVLARPFGISRCLYQRPERVAPREISTEARTQLSSTARAAKRSSWPRSAAAKRVPRL